LIAASQFEDRFPADITMINWPGNDYRDGGLIDRSAAKVAATLQDAKRVSLGFLYWLQTQAPAGSKRVGAPELMLRPDIMGSKADCRSIRIFGKAGESVPSRQSRNKRCLPSISLGRVRHISWILSA